MPEEIYRDWGFLVNIYVEEERKTELLFIPLSNITLWSL